MKKIPTLFERVFDTNGKIVGITDTITPSCEKAFLYGTATVKLDGSCCAIYHGELYKRFDAKPGRKIPDWAIPCQQFPDSITGHFPHWVKCDRNNPADKWYFSAWENSIRFGDFPELNPEKWTTFEAIGKHFNGNPYGYIIQDYLIIHGGIIISQLETFQTRTFENIRAFLREHDIEGIVFWYHDEPVCKIKRTDFLYPWGNKRGVIK